ncbi:MAG: carboxypeptidase regulatory-like domain-containing protein, partial [Deltaproteobacteria bacterium]|nr:carboxypeptidase regulatory-like domain-containing protein [Deltaproteobacteria bacterium]
NIHISYFDGNAYDLRYISNTGGIWNLPVIVESSGDVGRYNSLVTDNNGFVHITYYNTNGTLRYANNISGTFTASLVDNSASVGTFNSLAIDKNGILHASYYDATNAKVKYAMRLTTGNWTNFRFLDTAGSVGQYPSIYLDTQRRPHVCYYDAFFGGELKYAYKTAGTWNVSTIDNGGVSNYNVGRYCNIKTDNANKVHISYIDVSRGNIKYITNSSGNWVSENPDNINTVGQFQTSLAIDTNNKIHISYYDSANGGELRYSNNVPGYWVSTVVDDGGTANANVGQYNSIVLDKNGFVHISYFDATNSDLKYATNKSGSFITSVIDSAGSVGSYSAIALDSNNNPVISYYDAAPNYNLKVAIYDGTSWSLSVADSHANNVGLFTSVSVDGNNKIHIAYYDATIYKIKYATNKYGSWQNFIIDNEGRLGMNGYTTGIYATPSGMVHIIYYDYLMRDLKYATNEN